VIIVVGGYGDERAVGEHVGIEEAKKAVLRHLARGDVARQPFARFAEPAAWLRKDPPPLAVGFALVLRANGLHALLHALV
jgi:hypothetical protein